ncbi:hypothetical protein [Halalkalibaculum sp. DA384]|uniref:hypothetical protein n=1 Tax=Halalkalibaculum sp. DA384 TaxID=3373606 RepID=UPI0037549013
MGNLLGYQNQAESEHTLGFIFGGGDCSFTKMQTEKRLREALEKYTTRAERAEFIRSTGTSTSRISPTPAAMARFHRGGKDCKHKNVAPQHQRFLDRIEGWLQEKVRAYQKNKYQEFKQQYQASITKNDGSPATEPADPNGSLPASGQTGGQNGQQSQPPNDQSPGQTGAQTDTQPSGQQDQQTPVSQGLIPGMSRNMSYITLGGLTLLALGTAAALSN